jgi:hypothetical protein
MFNFLKNFKKRQRNISHQSKFEGDWLDTPDGKKWEDLGVTIYDALSEAKVSVRQRMIVFEDGSRHTIMATAERLAGETGENVGRVYEQVILWLQEAADPANDEVLDDQFVESVNRWVETEAQPMDRDHH